MKKNWAFIFIIGIFSFLGGKISTNWFAPQSESHQPTFRVPSSEFMSEKERTFVEEVNRKLISIKSKDQVIPAIKELQDLVSQNPDMKVLKLYELSLRQIPLMEGIVWRLRPLVEACYTCHVRILSYIKWQYSKTYLMGPHVSALLDFFVEPNKNEKPFESFSEVQDFISSTMIPIAEGAYKDLDNIINSAPEGYLFDLDSYLALGFDDDNNVRFISDEKRQRKIVRGNLHLYKARKARSLALMYYGVNYNVEDIPAYINEIVKHTGLNSIDSKFQKKLGSLMSLGRKDRDWSQVAKTLPKPNSLIEYLSALEKFPKIGTPRSSISTSNLLSNLNKSMNYFYESAVARHRGRVDSYNETKNGNSIDYLIQPDAMALNHDQIVHDLSERVTIWKNAVSGKGATPITSTRTGMQFEIDPRAFFKGSDLKVFLPHWSGYKMVNNFKQKDRGNYLKKGSRRGPKTVKNKKTGESIWRWNYDYGHATWWKDPTMNGLLPNTTNNNVYEKIRSVRYTPSTRRFGAILPTL